MLNARVILKNRGKSNYPANGGGGGRPLRPRCTARLIYNWAPVTVELSAASIASPPLAGLDLAASGPTVPGKGLRLTALGFIRYETDR